MASAIKASVTPALDPNYSPHQIKMEPLDLGPIGEQAKVAFLLRNVLTPAECANLIELSEGHGYNVAMINYADGQGVVARGYRDGSRVMIDDPEAAGILFGRISSYLPPKFPSFQLLEVNERLRFLRYGPTDKFMPHRDGSYQRDGAKTFVTLQIYLNEGFGGGATTFLEGLSSHGKRVPVVPETGMILVFQHDILHEGSVVTEGTKYTIRGDVLYKFLPTEPPRKTCTVQ